MSDLLTGPELIEAKDRVLFLIEQHRHNKITPDSVLAAMVTKTVVDFIDERPHVRLMKRSGR